MKANIFPKSLLVVPQKGVYMAKKGNVLLEVHKSPSSSWKSNWINRLDFGTASVSIASAGVLIAGILSAPIAAPVIAAASVVGSTCAAYSSIKSGASLRDRHEHEQSVCLTDRDARGNWFRVLGGITEFLSGGVLTALSVYSDNGGSLGKMLTMASDFLNVGTTTTNGFCVANGAYGIFNVNIHRLHRRLHRLHCVAYEIKEYFI